MHRPDSFRHITSRFARVLFCALVVLIAALPHRCFGQAQNTGTIAGTVYDSSKGAIPGATVTLTSEDRGNVYKATTGPEGQFTFNDLPSGSYTIEASAEGFASFISRHAILDTDTRLRIDAVLNVGSVTGPAIEVNADAVAVDTQGATVGTVIDNELVENLPIDGNNVVALASLLPGVTDVSAPTTFTDENGGATFNANGARGNSNLFLFDGLLWNNLYLNTGINYPNHAVLQQVSVQLNNYAAQYGRSSGSIFNVVSKQGSNATHGEIFFHFHDAATDAKDYFSGKRPPQHTYQYGIAVGGPIIRDKLFYEAEFQSLTGFASVQANAQTLSPNEEGLNADGTPFLCTNPKLAGKQCASFADGATSTADEDHLIVNPLGASPIPNAFGVNISVATSQLQSTWTALGNTGTNPCVTTLQSLGAGYLPKAEIPAECFDPTVQAIIKRGYIPTPDTKLGTSQYLYSSAVSSKPQHEYGGFLRVDWNLSPRQTMGFRFYRSDNSDLTSNGGSNANTGVPTYEVDANAAYITAGSVTHTFIFTPNVANVATLGYTRYDYNVLPTDTTTLQTMGSTFTYPGFQSLPTLNISTRFTLGNSLSAYTRNVGENFELIDNLSYVRGRHNFQFGVDILHQEYLNVRTNVGNFGFYGNPGFTDATGSDFIMGLVYTESIGNTQRISAIQNALYGYGQDNWRLSPRLTLNLGIRYELPEPWYQPDGQAATFIRGFQSTKIPNAPANLAFVGDPGIPKGLINTDYTNVSPRVGLSYDVFGNGKTALRLGFGTFYDAIPATIVGLTQPYTYRANYTLPAGSLTNPLIGVPAIPENFTGKGTPAFTTPYSVIFPDANFRNSYTMAVNAGIQQQLSKGTIFETNYILRLARHQLIPVDQNPAIVDCSGSYFAVNPALYCTNMNVGSTDPAHTPNPTYQYANRVKYPGFNYGGGGVVDLLTEAVSNYNALQITFRQRSYRNLTMLANYTYSRTLDEQSSLSTSSSVSTPDNIAVNYGPSDQNTTQIFNMGWRLGFPKIRHARPSVKYIFNDWAFNGIYNARTGHPVNITFGGDEIGNDEPGQRAYLIPGMSPTLPSNRHRSEKVQAWFNSTAYQKPAAFTQGNIGRNSIIGPAYINTQMSATKNFTFNRLHEGMRAQFRAEAFNIFNTVNLAQPRSNYSAANASSKTFGSINAVGTNGNRRIQFGLLLNF